MRIRRKPQKRMLSNEMTSMIDIVFLLLAFFVMTFQIVATEGDFNIRMPSAGPPVNTVALESPVLQVHLAADESGQLTSIKLGEQQLGTDFARLRQEVLGLTTAVDDSLEVELDCDPRLDYRYTVDALTAVTGYKSPDGKVVTLVEKVRFAPRRKM